MLQDKKIGFIGGGNMAEAIIKGLLAGGVPSSEIAVAEPVEQRRAFLRDSYGVNVAAANQSVVSGCSVLILSIKPQIAELVLGEVAATVAPDQLLISIMAGVKTATIEALLPAKSRVIRVMPNTPALVMEAASAICAGAGASSGDVSLARRIFDLIGKTFVLEEKLLDAVTGLSGSGPAYVYTFIEALSDAGVKNGLPRDIATALAAQTVYGSARLILETREHPAILREKVTSPGGTTIAGLAALEQHGFRSAIIRAVDAATLRSKELGNK